MTLKEFNELMKANNVPEDTVLMCHSEYDMRPVLLKGVTSGSLTTLFLSARKTDMAMMKMLDLWD